MKLSQVKVLKPGDRVQLKDNREEFSDYFDRSDSDLIPGKVIAVDEIDIGEHRGLQILGHYEDSGKTHELWVNHKSVKEYKHELPSSS